MGDYYISINKDYEKSLDAKLNKLVDYKYVNERILSRYSLNKYNVYSYDFKQTKYKKQIF